MIRVSRCKEVLKSFIKSRLWWLYAKPVNDIALLDISMAIAKRIGVKPFKVIKVVEAGFYNAMVFSFSCKGITITSLLKEASRDVLEGVMLHEYAHCKLKHGLKLLCLASLLLFLSILIAIYIIYNSATVAEVIVALMMFAIMYMAIQLILRYVARRFEYEADLFAVSYTSNSCAYISMLRTFLYYKSTKNRFLEILDSHPSPLNRIEYILKNFPELSKCIESAVVGPGGLEPPTYGSPLNAPAFSHPKRSKDP